MDFNFSLDSWPMALEKVAINMVKLTKRQKEIQKIADVEKNILFRTRLAS